MQREFGGRDGEREDDVVHHRLDRGQMKTELVDVGVVDGVGNGAVRPEALKRLSDLLDSFRKVRRMSEKKKSELTRPDMKEEAALEGAPWRTTTVGSRSTRPSMKPLRV